MTIAIKPLPISSKPLPAHGQCFQIEITSQESRFDDLERDWDDLFQRAKSPHFSQSFAWYRQVWSTLFRPTDAQLRCIIIWCNGRIVLAFPVIVRPYHKLWKAAFALGTDGDYTDVLIDAAHDSQKLIGAFWRTLHKDLGCDFLIFCRIRDDVALSRFLSSHNIPPILTTPSYYASPQTFVSWDEYWRSRKASFRTNIDRRCRRLANAEGFAFRLIDTGEQYRNLIKWTFDHKRIWSAEKKQPHAQWLHSSTYEKFHVVSGSGSLTGGLSAFALYVGDRLVATQINRVDTIRVESLITTYDLAFAQYGPGLLLNKLAIEWAHKHNLTFDFLFGDGALKRAFGTGACRVGDYHIIASRWGRAHARAARVVSRRAPRLARVLKRVARRA